MAKRPVFTPDFSRFPYFKTLDVEFHWYPGFARSQFQKSINSLHQAAEKQGISSILEISGKSALPLGVSLSAFNLKLQVPNGKMMSVECAYQGSKVFENGGPYHDLYAVSSPEAKTDNRLQTSGELTDFNLCGKYKYKKNAAFYDSLYIMALWQNGQNLVSELDKFEGFSDIVFNPQRSFNCQARAAAIFVSLSKKKLLNEEAMQDMDSCMRLFTNQKPMPPFSQRESQLAIPFPD